MEFFGQYTQYRLGLVLGFFLVKFSREAIFLYFFSIFLRGLFREFFSDDHDCPTHHGTDLVRRLFSTLMNYLKM